jgi:DNA-directed RNA polymerase
VQNVKMLDEKGLLEAIVREQVPLQHLFADRSFATNEEAEEVMRLLSRASIEANMAEVVRALGEVERLGKVDDALVGVPEALPVLKTAVDPETQEVKTFTPFNIDTLRRHLAQVSFARQVLPGDPAARQKLLEQSVLDVAEARRAHEDAQLDALGVATGRQSRKLQKYMWDWHLALRERLKDDVAAVVQEEKAAAGGRRRERISPFLVLLKADKLSLLTIMELIRLCGTGGVVDGMKSARALIAVGKAVEDAYHAELARKHDLPMPSAGRAEKTSQIFSSSGYGVLHKRRIAAAKAAEDMEDWSAEWSQILRVKVGSFLVDALMKVATVEVKATNKRTNEEECVHARSRGGSAPLTLRTGLCSSRLSSTPTST